MNDKQRKAMFAKNGASSKPATRPAGKATGAGNRRLKRQDRLTTAEALRLPTIESAHFHDVKYDDGDVRILQERSTKEDGAEIDNALTTEYFDGRDWHTVQDSVKELDLDRIHLSEHHLTGKPDRGPHKTMADVRAANGRKGGHFFDRSHTAHARSRVAGGPYGGRYFVTDDESFDGKGRDFRVWVIDDDGSIRPGTSRMTWSGKAQAVHAAKVKAGTA